MALPFPAVSVISPMLTDSIFFSIKMRKAVSSILFFRSCAFSVWLIFFLPGMYYYYPFPFSLFSITNLVREVHWRDELFVKNVKEIFFTILLIFVIIQNIYKGYRNFSTVEYISGDSLQLSSCQSNDRCCSIYCH